jgi:hypothetical protein
MAALALGPSSIEKIPDVLMAHVIYQEGGSALIRMEKVNTNNEQAFR